MNPARRSNRCPAWACSTDASLARIQHSQRRLSCFKVQHSFLASRVRVVTRAEGTHEQASLKKQLKVPVKSGPANSMTLSPELNKPYAPELLEKGQCPCGSDKPFKVCFALYSTCALHSLKATSGFALLTVVGDTAHGQL